ncbi:MAG TPA: ABC transporter substrate-binding protein [Pirellulaceae bacterium]
MAQETTAGRLMDQQPFDVLTLDKANESKIFKIYPVRLPGRKVPDNPRRTEKIRIKLLENDEEYDVAWANIAKLELYEQLVVAEVNKFTTEGKLDDAYDELAFLLTYYPQAPGLGEARQNYLYVSSAAVFRQRKFDEALAILEELIALNPNFRPGDNAPPLMQRLGDIADRLIGSHVQKEDFAAARELLMRLSKQYKLDGEPFATKWRHRLEQLATRSREDAQKFLAEGRFVEAQDAASRLQIIWPQLPGASEIVAEVTRRHPLVRVGVEHPAVAFDSASLFDVAARRAGRLVGRLLVERTAVGTEGGRYDSPVARLSRSDDGLSLLFQLNDEQKTSAYDLAQRLLARATAGSDEFDTAWSSVVSSIELKSMDEVEINLRSSVVLPEALLCIPLSPPDGSAESRNQPYTVLKNEGGVVRFGRNDGYRFGKATQPAEIVERTFSDPLRAVMALKRGEIDVLDRVFPGDVPGLKSDNSLAVAAYAGPTTHALAARSQHPYLTSATFRRALLYGSNRELLLSQGLMRGAPLAGFRVVSGPFPAPVTGMELPTYGYDAKVEPRAFDPRLAIALVGLAENELKAKFEKQQKAAPKLTPLVLGHPADEVSRIACRGFVKDWKRIGVECKLMEFAPGKFDDGDHKCDLVYLQLQAWEPVVDARRLFGPDGLVPSSDEHIQLALRNLQAARNWQQVRERLIVLHRLVHEDVSIFPLWQTFDHFAYRRSLEGLKGSRLSLYQDVERWQVGSRLAKGQP